VLSPGTVPACRCRGDLGSPRQRTDQPFFAGFFFAGAATERTVLTLPASALTPVFFDMAIAFYLCMVRTDAVDNGDVLTLRVQGSGADFTAQACPAMLVKMVSGGRQR
jgi:hypothetical protein